MHAPGSAGSSGTGSGNVRMLRISGPSDLMNGAGQLLAAGARQVQGVKQVLQVCSSDRLPFFVLPPETMYCWRFCLRLPFREILQKNWLTEATCFFAVHYESI